MSIIVLDVNAILACHLEIILVLDHSFKTNPGPRICSYFIIF